MIAIRPNWKLSRCFNPWLCLSIYVCVTSSHMYRWMSNEETQIHTICNHYYNVIIYQLTINAMHLINRTMHHCIICSIYEGWVQCALLWECAFFWRRWSMALLNEEILSSNNPRLLDRMHAWSSLFSVNE